MSEKIEEINGFEKYSEWFKIILKKCNMNNLVDIEQHGAVECFYVDGLHVFKRKDVDTGETYITVSMKRQFSSNPLDIYMSMYSEDFNADVDKCSMNIGIGASIDYYKNGTTNADLPSEDINPYSSGYTNEEMEEVLESQARYLNIGNLNNDMLRYLEEARDRADDSEMIARYDEALELYTTMQQLVIKEQQKENGEEAEQSGKKTLMDLDNLSEEELANMLELLVTQNQAKEEELKNAQKRKLIAQIIQEQQKGKELDKQLKEAKSIDTKNR